MNEDAEDDGWPWFGVYLYRGDGTYARAVWAKTREEFVKLLPENCQACKEGIGSRKH